MSDGTLEHYEPQPNYFRRFRLHEFLQATEREPVATEEFIPTDASPGSQGKIDALADRFQMGLPLWHRDDFRWDQGECDRG